MQQTPSIYCRLATIFGLGKSPVAPGTVATLFAGVPFFLIVGRLSWQIQAALAFALFLAGAYVSRETERELARQDPREVVIDELCGYLIAMVGHPPGFLSITTGFLLFRAFDIWKPWPIRSIDRDLTGGIGIMLDDVVAGIFANILGLVILRLAAA